MSTTKKNTNEMNNTEVNEIPTTVNQPTIHMHPMANQPTIPSMMNNVPYGSMNYANMHPMANPNTQSLPDLSSIHEMFYQTTNIAKDAIRNALKTSTITKKYCTIDDVIKSKSNIDIYNSTSNTKDVQLIYLEKNDEWMVINYLYHCAMLISKDMLKETIYSIACEYNILNIEPLIVEVVDDGIVAIVDMCIDETISDISLEEAIEKHITMTIVDTSKYKDNNKAFYYTAIDIFYEEEDPWDPDRRWIINDAARCRSYEVNAEELKLFIQAHLKTYKNDHIYIDVKPYKATRINID